MANITRYSPFRDVERFSPFHELENLWRNMDMRMRNLMGDAETFGDISVDVSEDEKAYTVKADLPGVNKEDIKVSVEGDRVAIAAEVKRDTEKKEGSLLRQERFCGQLYRTFTLGSPVDDEHAEAKYENGVLELILPKKAGAGTRRLEIH